MVKAHPLHYFIIFSDCICKFGKTTAVLQINRTMQRRIISWKPCSHVAITLCLGELEFYPACFTKSGKVSWRRGRSRGRDSWLDTGLAPIQGPSVRQREGTRQRAHRVCTGDWGRAPGDADRTSQPKSSWGPSSALNTCVTWGSWFGGKGGAQVSLFLASSRWWGLCC